MTKSSILIDLDDPKTARIAEVLSNKTSKKIVSLLAEKDMSESEIASSLKIPANTVNYNIKKLSEAGLIERVEGFLWSQKGKRVYRYRASNKKIVISPIRSKIKGVIPAVLASVAGAILVKVFVGSYSSVNNVGGGASGEIYRTAAEDSVAAMAENAPGIVESAGGSVVSSLSNIYSPWAWFLLGAWFALLVFVLWTIIRRDS